MAKAHRVRNTAYFQGFADGRKGRPFRYIKPKKRMRKRGRPTAPPFLYWYYTTYATGYRNGVDSHKVFWVDWLIGHPWVAQTLLLAIGAFTGAGVMSILIGGL